MNFASLLVLAAAGLEFLYDQAARATLATASLSILLWIFAGVGAALVPFLVLAVLLAVAEVLFLL